MKQRLALRFEITPTPRQKRLSELIVAIGNPSKCCLQPKNGQKWFDVKAGDGSRNRIE